MNTEPEHIVDRGGTQRWRLNDLLHRTDGPAVIYPDGRQFWYQKGERHRTDGPAAIYPDGNRSWWLNGERLTFEQWLDQLDTTPRNRTLLTIKWSTR